MATLPCFVFSPNTLLSVFGLMRGPDTTRPTPAEDWRDATVDVIIPAYSEEEHIVFCLASVLRQTLRPRRIVLVDVGALTPRPSAPRVLRIPWGRAHRRPAPPVDRQDANHQAVRRELDSDVLFVLDADTVAESPDYIRRSVVELHRPSALPVFAGPSCRFDKGIDASLRRPAVRAFGEAFPSPPAAPKAWLRRLSSGVTNAYREVLYLFLQRFINRGQMALFGTTSIPSAAP
jgi:cellulose synthase/poly-beta-1,6-N-acetylglucosamine synthase-like glycosyltransferase